MKFLMRRDHLLAFCAFLLAFSLPAGCGGGTATRTPVDACSQDANRPNYCGDVSLRRFAGPVITYRIVSPAQATDIYQTPVTAVEATGEQMNSIRGGFLKWQAAIGGARQIVEVAADDSSAMIDVMVQQPQLFTQGALTEQLGRTDAYFSDVTAASMGGP